MKINNENFYNYFLTIIALVVIVLSCFNVYDKQLAVSDFSPFLDTPIFSNQALSSVLDGNYINSYVPPSYLLIIRYILEHFNNALLAQNIFILSFFFIGYFSMRKLFKDLNFNLLVYSFIPLLYLFNPIASRELTNGYTGAIAIYCLMPLLFLAVYKLSANFSLKWVLVLVLSIVFSLVNIQIFFWSLAPVFFFFLFSLVGKKLKEAFYYFSTILIAGIVALMLNSVSVLTLLSYSNNFTNVSFLNTFDHTYRTAEFSNMIVLLGNNGSRESGLGYLSNNYLIVVGILLFSVIVYFTIFQLNNYKKEIEKQLIFSMAICMLSLMFFIRMIALGYFDDYIINNNILMVSLRNPIKLLFGISFSYILLLAFTFNYITNRFNLKQQFKKYSYIPMVILVGYWLAFNNHFLELDFGFSRLYSNQEFYINEKYDSVNNFVSLNKENNFLYLPFDYSIQLKVGSNSNIVQQRMGSQIQSDSQDKNYLEVFYNEICEGDFNLSDFENSDIDYIILDKDPKTYQTYNYTKECNSFLFYGTPYVWGTFDFFNKFLKEKNSIAFENDYFIIYKINHDEEHLYVKTSDKKIYNIEGINYVPKSLGNILGIKNYLTSSTFSSDKNVIINLYNKNEDAEELIRTGYVSKKFKVAENEKRVSLTDDSGVLEIDNESDEFTQFIYRNNSLDYKNIITNHSFENGLWTNEVKDCDNFDKNPKLSMSKSTDTFSEGLASLELSAERHIACTYQKVTLAGGGDYYFSFDYNSPNARYASYHLAFDDPKKSFSYDNVLVSSDEWATHYSVISVPEDANNVTIYFYAKSDPTGVKYVNYYDNIKLIKIPNFLDNHFVISDEDQVLSNPIDTKFTKINDAKTRIEIKGVTNSFYIHVNEYFNQNWSLVFEREKSSSLISKIDSFFVQKYIVDSSDHFKFNNYSNVWFFDFNKYCIEQKRCELMRDGTYNVDVSAEFIPQRFLLVTYFVSIVTFVVIIFTLLIYFSRKLFLTVKSKKNV